MSYLSGHRRKTENSHGRRRGDAEIYRMGEDVEISGCNFSSLQGEGGRGRRVNLRCGRHPPAAARPTRR